MAAKFLIAAAVPFHTARLQASLNRNIFRKASEVEKTKKTDVTNPNESCRTIKRTRSKTDLRCQKNRIVPKSIPEEAMNREKLLKQHVADLKYKNMKLMLKNEALRIRNDVLESENEKLKFGVKDIYNLSYLKEYKIKASIKHTLFVSIPTQQEWILPKVFLFLLTSMWESVKQSFLVWNYWAPFVNMQLIFNSSLRYLLILGCLPWKSKIPVAGYYFYPMIVNG